MALVIIIIFVLFIIGAVIAVRKTLKKLDDQALGITVDSSQVRTAQEFLPFDNISENLLDLGGFKYRKIIECSSINYHLKTDGEKEMIEASFARFLNSLQFPITIYVQTREIDLSNYLESLRTSIDETVESFPFLKGYSEIFYSEMSRLPELTGNSKQKKKYIIVGYDEIGKVENLNDEEKRNDAMNELNLRVQLIIDGLSGINIKSNELSTAGILELLYTTYNREDYSNFDALLDGDYTTLMVGMDILRNPETGELQAYVNRNKLSEMDNLKKTENVLFNAENIINNEILSQSNLSPENLQLYKEVVDRLGEIKEELNKISINKGGNNYEE